MEIEQMQVGFMAVFCYIVWCPKTKEAILIDPAGDEDKIVRRLKDKGLKLKTIVNTHGHGDHTCGNARIQELTGAKIAMHTLDDQLYNSPEGHSMSRQWGMAPSPPVEILMEDGDKIEFGEEFLEVMHTPGHSPGGVCLYTPGHVFTGDTLFVGGIGRTDLPGASMEDFMKAIKERLLNLPGDTVVWPGHDYGFRPSSTIEAEKKTNPWLTGGVM